MCKSWCETQTVLSTRNPGNEAWFWDPPKSTLFSSNLNTFFIILNTFLTVLRRYKAPKFVTFCSNETPHILAEWKNVKKAVRGQYKRTGFKHKNYPKNNRLEPVKETCFLDKNECETGAKLGFLVDKTRTFDFCKKHVFYTIFSQCFQTFLITMFYKNLSKNIF